MELLREVTIEGVISRRTYPSGTKIVVLQNMGDRAYVRFPDGEEEIIKTDSYGDPNEGDRFE